MLAMIFSPLRVGLAKTLATVVGDLGVMVSKESPAVFAVATQRTLFDAELLVEHLLGNDILFLISCLVLELNNLFYLVDHLS